MNNFNNLIKLSGYTQ